MTVKNDKHTHGSTSLKPREEDGLDFAFCDTHRATQSLWGTIKAAQIRAHRDIKKEEKKMVTRRASKGKPAAMTGFALILFWEGELQFRAGSPPRLPVSSAFPLMMTLLH